MSDIATIYAAYAERIDAVLSALEAEGTLPPDVSRDNVSVEPPRDPSHGDIATNAAMVLAKAAKTNPRALAEKIVTHLDRDPDIESAEIAGPGFINLRVVGRAWIDEVRAIATLGDGYGQSAMGEGTRVNVEYVSANPTGPMHVGHARGAIDQVWEGDALMKRSR